MPNGNSQLLLLVVIFALLSIAQASLTLPSLVAKTLNSQLYLSATASALWTRQLKLFVAS